MSLFDTVMLKSGGPPMTVIEIDNKQVKCQWRDAEFVEQSEWFPLVCIVPFEDEDEGELE